MRKHNNNISHDHDESIILKLFVCYITGVCQTPPEGSNRPSYNAGKVIHDLWYDDGIVVLNYTGGDRCHKNQYERNTIITFVCNRHRGMGRPVFVDETEDCTYYISWHTNLVCEKEVGLIINILFSCHFCFLWSKVNISRSESETSLSTSLLTYTLRPFSLSPLEKFNFLLLEY